MSSPPAWREEGELTHAVSIHTHANTHTHNAEEASWWRLPRLWLPWQQLPTPFAVVVRTEYSDKILIKSQTRKYFTCWNLPTCLDFTSAWSQLTLKWGKTCGHVTTNCCFCLLTLRKSCGNECLCSEHAGWCNGYWKQASCLRSLSFSSLLLPVHWGLLPFDNTFQSHYKQGKYSWIAQLNDWVATHVHAGIQTDIQKD